MRLLTEGYGFLRKSVSLCFLVLTLLSPGLARSQDFYVDELLKKAEEYKLYDQRYWHVILHYKPHGSGFKSLVDDPEFFLSPEGKEDPASELNATIKALFLSDKRDDSHPKCRFIGRYEWLKEKLNIDENAFSDISCQEFQTILNSVQPRFAVLIFPASYMNNPASMFGHTLLRIDSSYESKLLSHAANYAAYVDHAGILYPIKGIFGFYKGYFKVFPYYERVKEYNDTEQRDMWEYDLNLSEEEVRRMFLHLWELKDIYSYYYFFDENCSYNLLFLLEAARPSLNLAGQFGPWVIPVDTIRAVKDSGVVSNIEYRPAMATRIRYITSLLNADSQETALKIANGEWAPDKISDRSSTKKITILDLAIENIQYKYNKQIINRDAYLKVFLPSLKERSAMGNPDIEQYKIPVPVKPEDGHSSNRISIGSGIKRDVPFIEARYRPAYHSLTDPDDGYSEGSQIVFTDTALRYYTDGRFKLHQLDVIDIISISPRSDFFKPLSWKIETGFTQKWFQDRDEHLIYQLNSGVGLAYQDKIMGLWYGLAEANIALSGEFKESYAVGIGAQVGTIKKITSYWKINLSAETLFYGIRESFQEYKTSAVQTFKLNQNNSLHLSISWEEIFHHEQTEAKLNWNYYF